MAGDDPRSRPALAGRAREHTAIDRLLDAAGGGISGALVLRGEARMGKTALRSDRFLVSAAVLWLEGSIGSRLTPCWIGVPG